MAEFVEIVEVGPRDGLQNEKRAIPVAEKIALIDCLSQAGFRRIEAASFVSPKWVPQMAGSGDVLAGITRAPGLKYCALTPNLRGLEDALMAKADEVAVFASASEGFSRANINATIAESITRFKPVISEASSKNVQVRGYISCVVECPYDGFVAPDQVTFVAEKLLAAGCFEISLGDTIGRAQPQQIDALLVHLKKTMDVSVFAAHFHDTCGRALANIHVALEHGIRVFDSAVGGLGGCPYAPGAAGNVATEVVANALSRQGFDHGLDMKSVSKAADIAHKMRSGS